MVEYYNISGIVNSTNFMDMGLGVNNLLGGYWFGWFVLFCTMLVVFVSLKVRGTFTASAFTASAWVGMFLSWMLRGLGFIDNYTMWGMVLLACVSVLTLFLSK